MVINVQNYAVHPDNNSNENTAAIKKIIKLLKDDDVEVWHYDDYRTLVALRDFRQGEVILELPTETLKKPDKYSLEVLPGIHVDCSNSLAGFINHSCNPNAAVRKSRIVAWSCIKAEEVITLDYHRTEQKISAPFDCICGSKNCRGRIE